MAKSLINSVGIQQIIDPTEVCSCSAKNAARVARPPPPLTV